MVRMRPFLSCLVFVILLAGCLAEPETRLSQDKRLVLAPQWSLGDWWTYKWESEIYGFSFETTVVVGNASAAGYGVGMDLDDYQLNALLFHLPAVGPLTRDLAYDVHEVLFEPVRFPLHDNLSWETTYVSAPVPLTAHAADVATPAGMARGFHITNAGHEAESGRTYNMQYAPSVGWFTLFERVEIDGRLRERITLLDHGSGHVGTVRVPGDIQVLFIEARQRVVGPPAVPPPLPVTGFDPPDDLDFVFAACLYGDAAGAYDVEVTSPRGTACANQGTVTTADTSRRIAQAEVENTPGAWEVRLVAAGEGLAIAEVLGYSVDDVTLGA